MGSAFATIGPGGKGAVSVGHASFFFDVGPEPSRGQITIAQQEFDKFSPIDAQGWDLVFHDGVGGSMTWKHIYYDRISSPAPGLVALHLVDSRHAWEHLTYTGVLNLTYDDNETYNARTINTVGDKPWRLKDVVNKIATKLTEGPKGTFIPKIFYQAASLGDFDSENHPIIKNFQAEFMPAGQALQGVLNTVGALVSIDLDGDIRISTHEDDKYSGQKFDGVLREVIGDDGLPNINKPKRLKVCFRTLREKKLDNEYWEAVMPWPIRDQFGKELEGDVGVPGEWGTVEDVLDGAYSIKEKEILKHYFNLEDYIKTKWGNRDWVKGAERHIKANFYKHFRYKAPTTTSEYEREQILPFHDTSATFSEDDDDEKHFTPIYSDETYAVVATGTKTPTAGSVAPGPFDSYPLKNDYLDPHCVKITDQNAGIVTFKGPLPVCKVLPGIRNFGHAKSDFSLHKAEISIVITYIKKFVSANGLENDYYVGSSKGDTLGYLDAWSGLGNGNGHTHTVVVDDVYYIEKDVGAGYSDRNGADIDAFSLMYAEDYFSGFIRKPSREVFLAKIPDIDHLDNGLRSLSISCDSSGGTQVTLKFHDPSTANPAQRHYFENIPPTGGCGNSISASAMKKYNFARGDARKYAFNGPEDIKYKGVMSHCANYGKRGEGLSFDNVPDFQVPSKAGMVAAEDIPAFSGSGKFDRHSLHCRVHAETGPGTPHYIYPAPFDYAYHHTTKRWNPKLISKPIKNSSKRPGEPDINSPAPPKITTGGKGDGTGGTGGDAGGHPRGHGITVSTPMAEGGGGDATAAKTSAKPEPEGNTSTFVWDRSDEVGPSNKGALNNVLMLDLQKKCGSDPEGNT